MSLKKRHIGRRVAGVGVGVALLMLGLEAPAFGGRDHHGGLPDQRAGRLRGGRHRNGLQGLPSGPDGCRLHERRRCLSPNAADCFAVISDTTIWAVVPAAGPGTSYNVRVDKPGQRRPRHHQHGDVPDNHGVGGCAPTITSFTPTCGSAGDIVVITGTNLIDAAFDGG